MAGSRVFALLLGTATLFGCSPYVYDQEIAGFGTGVDAVVASYRSGAQAIETIAVQRQQAADAATRRRLLLLPGCDQTDPGGTPPTLPECAVVAFDAKAAPAPAAVQQNLAHAAPAFDALKAYATALSAVTAATDETALNQATQSLTTAAGGVAGAAAKLPPKVPASALIGPAGELLGQGIAFWLDQQRLVALRNTVSAMDPDVQALGQTVQAALADIRAQQVLQLGRDLRGDAEPLELPAVSQLSAADYQRRRVALEASIAAFNQARAADPAAAIAAMVKAHRQLTLALLGNAGQEAAALTGMRTFVATAEKLQAALAAPVSATAWTAAPATKK